MINRLLFTLALFFLFSPVYSQQIITGDSSYYSKSIEVKSYCGSVIPHQKILNPLKKGLTKAVEISLKINTNGNKVWHKYYNHPEIGVSYLYMDFGYKEALGQSYSIYPFIVFPLSKQGKPLSINIKTAIGFAYINKTYDSLINKENIAISTHLDFCILIGFNVNYQLSSQMSLNLGVNAIHFSNGSIKRPNYGLNILTSSFGINYYFSKRSQQKLSYSTPSYKPRWLAIVSGGTKEVNYPNGSRYGIGSFSIEYSKPCKTLLRYGASFDYMYDGSTIEHFKQDSISYQNRIKALKVGIACMGEMSFDRLSAFANIGVYLYNRDRQIDPIYQRVGLRYRINKIFYLQVSLKTHLNIADYLEYGILIKI